MTKSKLIHIKLDYDEAVRARRDILNTEIDFLEIAKSIRRYKALRLREFQLKLELQKRIKDFKTDSRKLKALLPKLEIPKILKKHEEEMKDEKEFEVVEKEIKKEKPKKAVKGKKEKIVKKKEAPEDSLEKELSEIQSRLRRLE